MTNDEVRKGDREHLVVWLFVIPFDILIRASIFYSGIGKPMNP